MIEFAQTPDVHFFLCRQCRAHIALTQDLVFMDMRMGAYFLRSAVNVHVGDDPMDYKTLGDCTIADAYCHRCKIQLGWMFAGVPEFVQVGVLDFNIIVRVGNVLLYPRKLLYWDGSQILYAYTHQPVEDSSRESFSDG
ncbi:uncharacterized protein LOC130767467 [Actinidia eriantha]|uniref:uncharacterized protein LOC130767467 n=1 Tax=Actinidia eriantha TaxID=165200 RepID=UPI00258F1750|nr:uncharacterized protein LOC130767467 [Actinidia eriantha]